MEIYKPRRGIAIYELMFFIIAVNIIIYFGVQFFNTYTEVSLVKIFSVAFSIYCLFYVLQTVTLRYKIHSSGVEINALWGIKKIFIPYEKIDGYNVQTGAIKGMNLSGVGRTMYNYGRSVIEDVGTSHMFVTSSKQVLYIHTDEISYGISPNDIDSFLAMFKEKGIDQKNFEIKYNKNRDLFKEKSFLFPFMLVALIIVYMTLNPFVLYLMNKLPDNMPLFFDATFRPVVEGTGKQFAFRQMTYGALNMIILFCMHYAAYFCAKYDKRSAYKYIYIALLISSVFLAIQIRILHLYL
ncbi:PH domain-containing protein [Clostridium fungisolvens]|uniref:Bacterial Pleckstrin homology domain-containing protein n=1 Tax=Clostridium fungisolvens TaxID=1604897 RepID=A0A6V8SQ72_9CLOT|nr:PH domain-containing protein [Clostridium fungisolvens]GFP77023.1 hypothetical protein bsdtw1_03137 [Clostridium fungisolvens]